MLSPNSSSPSSSSSTTGSSFPSSSESSSNGGRSRPGLDVSGSRPRLDLAGLVADEKGSDDGSSCVQNCLFMNCIFENGHDNAGVLKQNNLNELETFFSFLIY